MCEVISEPGATVATGARVSLRRPGAADVPEMAALLTESADLHRGWVSYPASEEQVLAFLTQSPAEGMEVFCVQRRSDEVIVGLTTLCRISGEPWLTAECGGAVGVRYQGNGYIAEAMRLLAWFAFSGLGLHRVEALAQPGNGRSHRMLAAAGFQPEGTARGAIRIGGTWADHVRWATTAEDLRFPRGFIAQERG
ncbi:MAG TPA: GNAT family protein [Streptosporangiaceae bacterium]|nr:GNAT family protein [Streptosporangiaceae bacterium]